jgi:outer membrane lipoprotein-sorting protein
LIGGIGASIAWRGWRRIAYIALAAALLMPGLESSGAKTFRNVPLPRPRPQFVDATPTASATPAPEATADPDPAAATTAVTAPAKPPKPAFKASANSRFTPEQQEALATISDYFNGFRTMEGQFIQFGPNGEQSEGVFFISKPGKIRFHYRPPVKLDVIADGRTVAVRDNRTMTQDYYPLSKTPLRYLLADHVDLTSDKVVSDVREEPDLIAIVIVEKTAFVDGKLTLIFDRRTFELRQWIVTDAQGLNTSVAIYNVATGKQPDPGLFKITYLQGPNLNGR